MKLGTIGRRKAPAELYESLGIADYSPGYWNIANAHQSPEFLRWVDAGYLRKADAVPPGHKVREADALELETLNRTHPAPKPAARLSQADVVRLVFRGDKAAFERASDLNFPSAKLALIAQNGRRTLAWVESDISRWSETVAAVARAIGTR